MYERNGTLYRDLFKAYGLRFIIKVSGEAGKFAIVPLLLNIGSGIGLLAIVRTSSVVSGVDNGGWGSTQTPNARIHSARPGPLTEIYWS